MGLVIVLAYIALNLLSPADLFPIIAPYRPILILALASLPLSLLDRMQSPQMNKLRTQFVLVLLFFGFALGSWLPHGWWSGGLFTLLAITPNIIVYFVGLVQFRNPFRLRLLRITLVCVASFVIIAAFFQLPYARAAGTSTPYVMARMAIGQVDVRIRGLGMLQDPNVFGQFLLLILPMLYVATEDSGMGLGYLFAVPVTLLFLVGLYYTNSRGAETGLGILIALVLIKRFGKVGAVMSGVIGSILILVINLTRDRTITMSSGNDRLAIWSEGMQYFKHSPIYGIGFGEFSEKEIMTAHNSFLLVAAELGIVGYFLWMSMITVTVIQLNRVPKVVGKTNPGLVRWATAVKFSLLVYLYTSFYLSRAYELPLFLLLGVAGAIITAAGGDDAIPLRGTMWQAKAFGLCIGILVLIYIMLRLRVV